jgi:Peptidase family S41
MVGSPVGVCFLSDLNPHTEPDFGCRAWGGAALREGYLYPDVGRRLSDLLDEKIEAGEFEGIRNPVELGGKITAVLQEETKDLHLIVWAAGGAPAALRSMANTPMVARAERLAGNIGYIDLRTFTGKTTDVDGAFDAVKGASALIIDVGQNLGGEPPIVQYISSYLFTERTHLLDVLGRGDAGPQERWTLDRVVGRRLPGTPVYVLTSASTFSAAESFTFGLRVTGRATVVGERTRGGGHFVRPRLLPHGFQMLVPIGRAYDPRTGKGWQVDGIAPDIEVPYAEALARALDDIHRRIH